MSIFGNIMNKIFRHGSSGEAQASPQAAPQPARGESY